MILAFDCSTMSPIGTAATIDAARWAFRHWGDGEDDFLVVFDLPDSTARAVMDPMNAHRAYKMLKRNASNIVWRGVNESAQRLMGGTDR